MDETRNKLVELLGEIQDSGCSGEIEVHGRNYPDTISNEKVAAHLISNGVTVQRWIPVTERLPENEVEVLILAERRYCCIAKPDHKTVQIVAKAFHTDGKMNTEDSGYTWELWDTGADYDEEADAYIIPEGWWESVTYGEEFAAVDDFVTHWMPMPQAPGKEVNGNG